MVDQTGPSTLERTLPVSNIAEDLQALLLFTHSSFIFDFLTSHDTLQLVIQKPFLTLFLRTSMSLMNSLRF